MKCCVSIMLRSIVRLFLCRSIPDLELSAWRYSPQVLLFVAVWPRGKSLCLSKPTYPWMALITVLSFLTQLCSFAAVPLLPLGVHNLIYHTTILVTLVILTRAFLEEETGKVRLLTLVVLLVGIVLVLQPEPLFYHDASAGTTSNITLIGDSPMATLEGNTVEKYTDIYAVTNETLWRLLFDSRQENVTSFDVEDHGPTAGTGTVTGYILIVASGIFEAFWFLTAGRPLAAVDPVVQTFWMGSVLTPTCLVLMVYCESPAWPSGALHFNLILGHSIGSLAHIIGACICSQVHSPLVTATFLASSIIMSFTIQHTVFIGTLPGTGNWIEIVGVIIATIAIVAGPLFDLLVRRRQDAQVSWERM